MTRRRFKAGFFFCGLGAGAKGFLDANARLGEDEASFINLGGIDNDPAACLDFGYLTGGAPALCADLSKLTPAELRANWGQRAPDALFTSPPCKGFSGLLSAASAGAEKYQELNKLVLQGMFLACETWERPPGIIVIENVPRITSRGAKLLEQVRSLLGRYGYLFHESTHDCGEIGGLAQHRRRFLLVARQPDLVPAYIYRPPKRRVRACGEVLGELPMPGDPDAGELHSLPRLSWLNWVRLSLIPAGGDWRDLPGMADQRRGGAMGVTPWTAPSATVVGESYPSNGSASVADPRLVAGVGLKKTAEGADSFKGRPGLFGVTGWDTPAPTVTGSSGVSRSNAPAAIADPRVEEGWFRGVLGVVPWTEPTGTVTGASRATNGSFAVADPRLATPLEPGQERRAIWARYDVRPWDEPARTVAGEGSNAGFGVADPRLGMSVDNPGRHHNKYVITPWTEPSRTVIGATRPGSGALSVADPRLRCAPRAGAYGVISWQDAAATVTGAAGVDNGRFAVADPRSPGEVEVPIIIAADGTWHRPLTTLELAALQGIPARVDGAPLKLAGKSVAKWRERIGNAVPVQAATAIAETLLTALLAAALGTWTLGSTGIWVRDDGRTEDEVNADFPLEERAA